LTAVRKCVIMVQANELLDSARVGLVGSRKGIGLRFLAKDNVIMLLLGWRRGILLILALLVLAGCSSDPMGRQAVSGTVLFKGQPLDQGRIQFVPVEKGPTESGAVIENGKYSIKRDNGLVPGAYKVSVWSYDQKGAKVRSDELPGESGATQYKERIQAKYNVRTTLTTEVKKDGSNTLDFKVD
jgi:uncharacterized protein YcfL